MSYPRFFVSDTEACARLFGSSEGGRSAGLPAGSEFWLSGENAHHALKVLRLQAGETLVLSCGDELDYYCEVLGASGGDLRLRFLRLEICRTETLPQIILWQGLPKGSKFEEIIEKSVELGVHRIVALKTARSLIKLDDKSARVKQARWQKISESAAKQSGRGLVPEVALQCSLDSALSEIKHDLALVGEGTSAVEQSVIALIAWEDAVKPSLSTYMGSVLKATPSLSRIHVLVGPEGGFGRSEVEAAVAAGIVPLSLGPRILRTETAGPAVLAMLNVLLPGKM